MKGDFVCQNEQEFSSACDLWSRYAFGYLTGNVNVEGDKTDTNVVIVRYEDLVLYPITTLKNLRNRGLPVAQKWYEVSMWTPYDQNAGQQTASGRGREDLIHFI